MHQLQENAHHPLVSNTYTTTISLRNHSYPLTLHIRIYIYISSIIFTPSRYNYIKIKKPVSEI